MYFTRSLQRVGRHAELKAGTNPPPLPKVHLRSSPWLTAVAVKYGAPGTARRNKTSTDSDPICGSQVTGLCIHWKRQEYEIGILQRCSWSVRTVGVAFREWMVVFWPGVKHTHTLTLVHHRLSRPGWYWTLCWRWNPAGHCKAAALPEGCAVIGMERQRWVGVGLCCCWRKEFALHCEQDWSDVILVPFLNHFTLHVSPPDCNHCNNDAREELLLLQTWLGHMLQKGL